ncbi:MAG: hypothetical protein IT438_04960 [Phycisphaerales bacterium]|nr:hypothetical protein [Phycisphaerales bacterium]
MIVRGSPAALAAGVMVMFGCQREMRAAGGGSVPAAMNPTDPGNGESMPAVSQATPPRPIVLARPGAAAWGSAGAEVIDTRKFPAAIQPETFIGEPRRVREVLPPHEKPAPPGAGAENGLVAGRSLDEPRTTPGRMWPSVGQTGWNPPDPTLAVGPNHAVVTVNSRVEFFTKAGVRTFAAPLDQSGSPGFFEPLGAGGFCFDPKCFYDHHAGRFVIVVLETYGSTEAWVDIAVSDDSDPNGTWYKYRTNAVIDDGTRTYWWDFPGAGYDQNAWYVTGNLFGLSSSGYGGFGVRVFDKSSMLSGGTATYATLRQSGYTVQPALHFGANVAGFMATVENSTTVKLWAVTNPLTAPALVSTNVTVPAYTGAVEAPSLNTLSRVSNAGMTMPYWRNGRLFMCHNASVGGRNQARWHEFDTGAWPVSGAVTRLQSGNVDGGAAYHTVFPAIAVNAAGNVGMSLGLTGEGLRVACAIAGRLGTDPPGRMGQCVIVKPGDVDAGGRWGDYYAVAVDPTDDTTFWAVAEYRNSGGWQNWVGSFTVTPGAVCHPLADDAGLFQIGVNGARAIDVMANDWHSAGAAMTITAFDATSTLGGTVARSVGTGPGGRDQLVYTPPASLVGSVGWDSFNYTLGDTSGNSAGAAVVAQAFYPPNYRNPENPGASRPGVTADWYALDAGVNSLPNFTTLTRYDSDLIPSLNIAATNGNISTSGRADNLGAIFDGYINVAASDVYRLYITSDDGSKLYLGSALIVDHNGTHGMTERASVNIGLKPGKHRVRAEYFEAGGGAGAIVSWSATGLTKAAVPAVAWFTYCAADFNRSASVTVQDLFDFLAAYFAGQGSADFNGSGATTVQDIFDYLTAYFGGC